MASTPTIINNPRDTRFDFACHVHGYLRQFVQSADQKAGFTLAASTALLGFVFQKLGSVTWQEPELICYFVVGILSIVLAVIAGVVAVIVVLPRQNKITGGLVSWNGILESKNAGEYSSSVPNSNTSELTDEVLNHCYSLATIVRAKYGLLRIAVGCFIGSGISTVILLILTIVVRPGGNVGLQHTP